MHGEGQLVALRVDQQHRVPWPGAGRPFVGRDIGFAELLDEPADLLGAQLTDDAMMPSGPDEDPREPSSRRDEGARAVVLADPRLLNGHVVERSLDHAVGHTSSHRMRDLGLDDGRGRGNRWRRGLDDGRRHGLDDGRNFVHGRWRLVARARPQQQREQAQATPVKRACDNRHSPIHPA